MILALSLFTIISSLVHIYCHKEIREILKEENMKVSTLFNIEDIGLFYRLAKYNSHLEGKMKLYWFTVLGLVFWILGITGLAIVL